MHFYVVIFFLRWVQVAARAVMVVSVLYGIAGTLQILLNCRPIEVFWNPAAPGTCANLQAAWLGIGLTNLVVDAVIVVLPLPVLWGLHMDVRRKLQLCGIFSLGFLCVDPHLGCR